MNIEQFEKHFKTPIMALGYDDLKVELLNGYGAHQEISASWSIVAMSAGKRLVLDFISDDESILHISEHFVGEVKKHHEEISKKLRDKRTKLYRMYGKSAAQ